MRWWRRFLRWWRRFLRWRWRRFLGAAPVPNVVGPVSNVSALVQDMLTSVAGAVVPLTQLQSDLYSFLLGIAGVAPVSDVSALVQDMLSSVVAAVVLLAQLPSDLFSFLLGIAGVQPVVGGVAGIHGRGRSAPRVRRWRRDCRWACIAHFARLGPLGIVYPMALRVVRPRALRVVRPGPLSAEHLLDKVA